MLISDEEKFDRIFGDFINETTLDDPGEAGTSAFGPPTANRNVLETPAVAEGSQFPYHDQSI